MPGLLRPDATCPVCGENLIAIGDLANSKRVIREYYHAKESPNRRPRRCRVTFTDHEAAHRERIKLEVRRARDSKARADQQ